MTDLDNLTIAELTEIADLQYGVITPISPELADGVEGANIHLPHPRIAGKWGMPTLFISAFADDALVGAGAPAMTWAVLLHETPDGDFIVANSGDGATRSSHDNLLDAMAAAAQDVVAMRQAAAIAIEGARHTDEHGRTHGLN